MVSLPIELWFYIAELIPPSDLLKLVGINRVFFTLIMNELYNQLSFITSDPRVFIDKLTELQSPGLAERIRVLTLWPSAVRDAVNAIQPDDADVPGTLERPTTPKPAAYLQKSRERVEKLLGHRRTASRVRTPPKAAFPSPEERSQMFHDAIRNLTRVEEYEINWYFDKGNKESAWKFSFFPEIWQSIGSNLRRLSIDVQVFKLGDIVMSSGSLPKVEELLLTLRSEVRLGHSGDTTIPYFLNKFSRTLQHLSIKTIGHQELSTIFQPELLGRFPLLVKLSIIMPLDAHHLRDPLGFKQLLQNNPTIRDLCIRYSRCCRPCTDDGFKTYDGRHQLYSGVSLPNLHALELGLHIPIPADHTSPMLNYIGRLGSDLTSLTLKDRSLTLEEIRIVLRLFPSYQLKRLSLFPRLLSPQLIDLIAKTCPDLNSLSMDVEMAVGLETAQLASYIDNVEGFALGLLVDAVDVENDRWRYRTWMLADVSVMKWEFKVGHQYNFACMKAIAEAVPSVRSFAGRGHMNVDDPVPKPDGGRFLVDLGNRTKPFDT
ncbi:hypothetical protein M413DRAFT_443337 [Hebeloma cylindrosporum]|uniref:F-box domain-containing protein n=1 Tax=Hebeloma cylindrosporum TaxID=76867 RepID=A0A0C3C634_HEBCY|nr:hypothetical protein M413DRAFT_443337 [Hebeloma cylindrosporum h7]